MAHQQYPAKAYTKDVDDIKNGDKEAKIQYYLEAYKHYIVKCINPEDLLFYEHFSIEKREYFREISRSPHDYTCVASRMIDTIISMEDVPGRFSALVKLFQEKFENEKVLRILKGEKIPTNRRENKEKIQKFCSAEICKNLNVTEIIPHLLEEKMISENEGKEIKNKAERDSPFSATIDLLLKLPHRHPNWYTRFLSCLVKSEHTDLAKLVDEKLSKQIIQDLSTRNNDVERPMEYRDDFMSCVSGSDNTGHGRRKGYEKNSSTSTSSVSTSLKNETDLKDITTYTKTVVPTEYSPRIGRAAVAKWVMSSHDMEYMEEISDTERPFDAKVYKKLKSSKKRLTYRPRSFACKVLSSSTFRKRRSKRHQTSQILTNQMAEIQKYFSKTSTKATSVNHHDDESQSNASFSSSRASMTSSMDSLEKDHSYVNSEFIDISKKISDLNQDYSGGEDIRHDVGEIIPTMDVKTNQHLSCKKIDRAIQTKAKVKTSVCPTFQQLLTMSFLHPVKISLLVKETTDIHNLRTKLDELSHKMMEQGDYSQSIKAHYVSTVIQKAKAAEDIDVFIDNLLTARESDGYFENQDRLISDVIEKYEYKETEIFKTIVAEMQLTDTGDGLSSLRKLIQILQRKLISTGDNNAYSANKNLIVKKDSACYVSEYIEKLNQFTDELKIENNLAFNEICSKNDNITKLKDKKCNTNSNFIEENDQICQVTDLSDTSKERKWNGITKAEVECDAKESDTMNSNTCKTCNNCITNREEHFCTERKRLKAEHATSIANNTIEETKLKTLNVYAATVEEERYTNKSTDDTNIGTKSNPCGCFIRDEADSISRSDVYLETMSPNSPDYKVIEEQKFKRCGVTIVCIHRISNQNMLSRFTRQKELLKENIGIANIQRLFHWSKHLKAVIEEGFDAVITEHGSEEFFFSNHPLLFEPEIHNFDANLRTNSIEENSRRRSILLCSVCLGKTKTGTNTSVPCEANLETFKDCHSVRMRVDFNNDFYLKYKIFNGDQVYPEYLVTYETLDT